MLCKHGGKLPRDVVVSGVVQVLLEDSSSLIVKLNLPRPERPLVNLRANTGQIDDSVHIQP
jgi:hypothetical protein